MMKAAVLESPSKLVVQRVKRPQCPPCGLIVKVLYCAICSSDARMIEKGHAGLVFPRIPGHEISGVIWQSRTHKFNIGDRVQIYPGLCCGICNACRREDYRRCVSLKTLGFTEDGGFAEYIAVNEVSIKAGALNLIPKSVTLEEAALTEPLASCINAQEKTRIGPGDTVLTIGGGPLGLMHSRLTRKRGAAKVLLAEKDDRRIETALCLSGADRVIEVSRERLPQIVSDETQGRGVNVVILATRSVAIVNALPLLADGGRLALFSGLPKDISSMVFDINQIHYRELEVSGSFGSTAHQNKSALQLIADKFPVRDLITLRVEIDEIMTGIKYTTACHGLRAIVQFPTE